MCTNQFYMRLSSTHPKKRLSSFTNASVHFNTTASFEKSPSRASMKLQKRLPMSINIGIRVGNLKSWFALGWVHDCTTLSELLRYHPIQFPTYIPSWWNRLATRTYPEKAHLWLLTLAWGTYFGMLIKHCHWPLIAWPWRCQNCKQILGSLCKQLFWQVKTLLFFHHDEPGTECVLFDGREGSPRLGRTSVVSHICCVQSISWNQRDLLERRR